MSLPYVEYVIGQSVYLLPGHPGGHGPGHRNENSLNRIVVAACTPKTHEALFQETLVAAGLNKYLFEMTNIRNHDSWVHKSDPGKRPHKRPGTWCAWPWPRWRSWNRLRKRSLNIDQRALVVGAGISGMAAATSLSDQGYKVCLVEREPFPGGQGSLLFRTWKGEDVQANLSQMVLKGEESDPNIDLRSQYGTGGRGRIRGEFQNDACERGA